MACVNDTFLIIGGSTKSGTTSLFHYLAAHPQVCKSVTKETRFFLDDDYPLPVKYRIQDGVDKYMGYFDREAAIYMESTPDYLYSAGTAKLIANTLPNATVVFVLRNPLTRLQSWFQFSKQTNRIVPEMRFSEYLDAQFLASERQTDSVPQHMRALDQGRYARYLKPFYDSLGDDNVMIVWFEDLVADPKNTVRLMCERIGIDCGFYESFTFNVKNKTKKMKSPFVHKLYMDVSRNLRNAMIDSPNMRAMFRCIKHAVDPVYEKMNSGKTERIVLDDKDRDRLIQYYSKDIGLLEMLVGKKTPWDVFRF